MLNNCLKDQVLLPLFVFCMAALHKALSPTCMSGEVVELRLLIDDRFRTFGHPLGNALKREVLRLATTSAADARLTVKLSRDCAEFL